VNRWHGRFLAGRRCARRSLARVARNDKIGVKKNEWSRDVILLHEPTTKPNPMHLGFPFCPFRHNYCTSSRHLRNWSSALEVELLRVLVYRTDDVALVAVELETGAHVDGSRSFGGGVRLALSDAPRGERREGGRTRAVTHSPRDNRKYLPEVVRTASSPDVLIVYRRPVGSPSTCGSQTTTWASCNRKMYVIFAIDSG
jgi:hypothetical protein